MNSDTEKSPMLFSDDEEETDWASSTDVGTSDDDYSDDGDDGLSKHGHKPVQQQRESEKLKPKGKSKQKQQNKRKPQANDFEEESSQKGKKAKSVSSSQQEDKESKHVAQKKHQIEKKAPQSKESVDASMSPSKKRKPWFTEGFKIEVSKAGRTHEWSVMKVLSNDAFPEVIVAEDNSGNPVWIKESQDGSFLVLKVQDVRTYIGSYNDNKGFTQEALEKFKADFKIPTPHQIALQERQKKRAIDVKKKLKGPKCSPECDSAYGKPPIESKPPKKQEPTSNAPVKPAEPKQPAGIFGVPAKKIIQLVRKHVVGFLDDVEKLYE